MAVCVRELNMRSKKEIEQLVLDAARSAGVPIPRGEVVGEEPDFRFHTETGELGIDVSELLRPAFTNHGIVPLEQEKFRQKILDTARKECEERGLPALRVHVCFTNPKGRKQDWQELTNSLVETVVANYQKATPTWSQVNPPLPEGFEYIVIMSEEGDWWSPTVGGISVSQIPLHIAKSITAKELKLPAYRKNLGKGAQIWLLLHSGVTIARSLEVPKDIGEWKFPFEFDRVFWFSFLEAKAVEILRAPVNQNYSGEWTRIEFVCECGTTCRIDVQLVSDQFGGQPYQHQCGTLTGRYVPGRIIKILEEQTYHREESM